MKWGGEWNELEKSLFFLQELEKA